MTSREAEVLELIAKGLTTRQIAEALSLSPRVPTLMVSTLVTVGFSTVPIG